MSTSTTNAPAEIWRWEEGTSGQDNLYGAVAAAAAADGSTVLTGRTQGGWDGASEGDFDFMAIKFKDGAEMWRLQAGTPEEDSFHDAVVATASTVDARGLESESTTIVLAGFTRGDWSGAGSSVSASGSVSGSDFAALGLAADGSELWRWQDGTDGDDVIVGAAVDVGGSSVVLAGRTGGDWAAVNAGGGSDFAVVKLRADDGSELWRFQDGSSEDDTLKSIAAAGDDGSFVLAGYTSGDLGGRNAGQTDLVAVKLSSDGDVVWRWQGGTAFADVLSTVLVGGDGSVVLAGYTSGSWTGSSNAGEEDYLVVKLDSDGNEIWVWQDGTPLKDRIFASALCGDGSVVLAGYSEGDWAEANAGGSDLAAVKLDAAVGAEIWRWQEGTPGSDWVTAATSTSDGTVVLAGTSERALPDSTSSSEPSTTTTTSSASAAAAAAGLTTEDFIAIELDVGCDKFAATPAPTEFVGVASGSGSGSGSGALAAAGAAATAATPAPFRESAATYASSSVSVNGNEAGAGAGATAGGASGGEAGGEETADEPAVLKSSLSSSASHSLAVGAAATPTPAVAAAGGQGGSASSSSSSSAFPAPAPVPTQAPYAIVAAPPAAAAEATRAPVDAGSTVRSPGLSDDGVGGSMTSGGLSSVPSFAGIGSGFGGGFGGGGGGGGGSVLLFCFAAAWAVRRASVSMLSL